MMADYIIWNLIPVNSFSQFEQICPKYLICKSAKWGETMAAAMDLGCINE